MQKNSTNDKTQIILIAYAISPVEGSESGAGWALLSAHIYLGHEVTLVTTSEEFRKLKRLKEFSNLKIKVIEVDEYRSLYKYENFIPFSFQLRHLVWNLQILGIVKKMTRFNPGAVVHYGTYSGDWNLNVLHFLKSDVLKLWGPVGGAQKIPLKLMPSLGFHGVIEDISKRVVGSIFRRFIKLTMRMSKSVIMCANSATLEYYSKSSKVVLSQNIILDNLPKEQNQRKKNLIFGCGRLIPWKNWKLAILAMRYVEDKHLIIAGEGPDMHRLKRIIKKNNLQEKVSLIGRINREEVLRNICECDVFVFPSLRDSASWALAEAVMLSCNIVALNLPGSLAITQQTGMHLVDPSKKMLEREFAKSISSNEAKSYSMTPFSLEKLAISIKNSVSELQKM